MTIGAKTQRPFPIQVEPYILDNYMLSIYGKMVFIVLCRYANREMTCWPSLEKIGLEASIKSRSKVKEALAELEEFKYIALHPQFKNGRQTTNMYTILNEDAYRYIMPSKGCPDCKDTGVVKNENGDFVRYCSCGAGRKRNALNSTR